MKIHIPGFRDQPNPLDAEFNQLVALSDSFGGLIEPDEMSKYSYVSAIGQQFVPGQLAPPTNRNDIPDELQPRIERGQKSLLVGERDRDERVLAIAHQIGRVMAADNATKAGVMPQSSITYTPSVASYDKGKTTIPIEVESGGVIELGLGINGLLGHLKSIKARSYELTGIQHSLAEVMMLRGILSFHDISEQDVRLTADGISASLGGMLRNGKTDADLLVASRVHTAGIELLNAARQSGKFLRQGGKLIARGPRRAKPGVGYDQVASLVAKNKWLEIVSDETSEDMKYHGRTEANRSIVAVKK